MQGSKKADRVQNGCGLLSFYAHIQLPRSGLAGCEDQVELFCGGSVGGLDGVGVDPCGRGRIGVAEAGGDGGDRDAGVDHQCGVRVAEAVNGDVRQVVGADEVVEPTADGVGMDRRTIRLGEQPVAVNPAVAHRETLLCLPAFVLLQELDRDHRRFDEARGTVVFRRLGDDTLVRDIERSAFDSDDRRLKINILPLEPAEFFAAHTREHEQFDHRAVLYILAVEQGKQAGGLFFVQIARASFLFFRE